MSPTCRKATAWLFLDHRLFAELVVVSLSLTAFLLTALVVDDGYCADVDPDVRSTLYGTLAGVMGALLGFILAGLAVLVALPAGRRLDTLRKHTDWERLPASFVRASGPLLLSLVLTALGIAVDHGARPDIVYQSVVLVAVTWALVRVVATVVALDQVLALVDADQRDGKPPYTAEIDDA